MDSVKNFLDLPNEIIEVILQDRDITHIDLCRISQTCTDMQNLCMSNELWRRKLHQRWPNLLQRYSSEKCDWLTEFKTCVKVGSAVRTFVSQLSPRYYNLDEISDDGFADVVSLMEEHNAAEVIINELNEIIHANERYKNLTNKYYAKKLHRHILHLHLAEKWKALLEEPPDAQKLEKGAIMLSQWFLPTENVTENDIMHCLDDIAETVKQHLPEDLASKYNQGLPLLSSEQERVVLETMNQTLYTEMGFRGNNDNYYDENNSFINKVLERKLGIPISLSILYLSVARRLGVVCECVNFPSHFLLKWREHPLANMDKQYTFIDAFNGKFLTDFRDIHGGGLQSSVTDAIPPIEVYKRMLRNLVNIGRNRGTNATFLRDGVELMLVTTPRDADYRFLLMSIYIHLKINQQQVKEILQEISGDDEVTIPQGAFPNPRKANPKRREDNKDVQFSVGMVMKHRRYDYMCVIFGWDSKCMMSREWIFQMGVHTLPRKDQQPFYNVLVEDGSIRYAADENLFHPDSYCEIPHLDVGKYFQEFTGQYYVMNKEKAEEYPDDALETRTVIEGLSREEMLE
ncbi:F-box only protein 21-like [Crassostrea virginica]